MYNPDLADNSANVISLNPANESDGAFKTNIHAGNTDNTVSNQWRSRPMDERYLNLDDLYNQAFHRANHSEQIVLRSGMLDFSADNDNFIINGLGSTASDSTVTNHWSFGQMCSMARTPAKYLRTLPSTLAERCLNASWATTMEPKERVMFYKSTENDQLHAATSPTYGRIHDYKVVDAVRSIAGSGTGETNWKVPGRLDWSTGVYNPKAEPTIESTTLYASDRDVFMFLVDDTRPIEIGKLPDGNPDIVFRGFYVSNSEVGKSSLEVSTFIMRAVCENRIIWGQEELQKIRIRHTRNAPRRFLNELKPALRRYSMASEHNVKYGIENAIKKVVADTPEKRESFLTRRGFTKNEAAKVINMVRAEEYKSPSTVWDFMQGITAVARSIENTDNRIKLEKRAGDLMKLAA